MHPRAWLWVLGALGEHDAFLDRADVRVIEFGGAIRTDGYDLRRVLPWVSWTAVDLAPVLDEDALQRNEVQQGDAATWGREGMADVVIATELLEHAADGPGIVENAARLLVPGGLFVATMAGPTRSPHGADGSPKPKRGEFYRNVEPWMLTQWLAGGSFVCSQIDLTDDGLDLRCWARR